jgi:2-polyprenyl-3-methyl-5-hydroxy-6-metoxy-1,4-benzoquinol methylase
MAQWYEELFKNFGESYEKEAFTAGTIGEADFIEREIDYSKTARILDIGCGTGRHSIELSKRGYTVTGIDLSESMLAKARKNASLAGVEVDLRQADAREFDFAGGFDLAIMLCEGAFSLMETDEMNFRILCNACSSLKEGGKLIFTTLNGLFPLFHSVKDFINSDAAVSKSLENSFDLMTFRDHSIYEATDDNGNKLTLQCSERYYVPSEISWITRQAGFSKVEIFGCRLGAFSRDDKLSHDDFEMLVIAEK